MSRTLADLNSITLPKLFPDLLTLEEKAVAFLKLCYTYGNNYTKIGRECGIHHNTAKALLDELRGTDIYEVFRNQIQAETLSFAEERFRQTIFSEYRAEVTRLRKLINDENTKEKDRQNYTRMLHQLMRDQLRATLVYEASGEKKPNNDGNQKEKTKLWDEVLDEAKERLNPN